MAAAEPMSRASGRRGFIDMWRRRGSLRFKLCGLHWMTSSLSCDGMCDGIAVVFSVASLVLTAVLLYLISCFANILRARCSWQTGI